MAEEPAGSRARIAVARVVSLRGAVTSGTSCEIGPPATYQIRCYLAVPNGANIGLLDPRTLGYVVGHAGREARSRSRVGQKEMAIDFLLPPPTFGDVALDRTIAPRLDRPVDLLVQVGRDQDDTTDSPWCSCGPS